MIKWYEDSNYKINKSFEIKYISALPDFTNEGYVATGIYEITNAAKGIKIAIHGPYLQFLCIYANSEESYLEAREMMTDSGILRSFERNTEKAKQKLQSAYKNYLSLKAKYEDPKMQKKLKKHGII